MFVIKQTASYSWPVVVEIPISGGKHSRHPFDAEFKRLPQSRLKQIGDSVASDELSPIEVCKEVLLGWKGVQDDNGELPYSEDARDMLLDIPGVARAILNAFTDSIAGAKAKN